MLRIYQEIKTFNDLVQETGIIPEHKDGDEGDCCIPTRRYILRGIKELLEIKNKKSSCMGITPAHKTFSGLQ